MSLAWTPKHIAILKEWKARCFVHLWLHDRSCHYYICLNNYLSYPIIIFASIASATLLASDKEATRYAVGGLSLVNGVLTSVLRQAKPGELQQEHSLSMRRYHNLIRNIDACLSLTPEMRPPAEAFLERVASEIDHLISSQATPPMSVVRRFEKQYGAIDALMYGEDLVELVKAEVLNDRLLSKYMMAGSARAEETTSDEEARGSSSTRLPIMSPSRRSGDFLLRNLDTV